MSLTVNITGVEGNSGCGSFSAGQILLDSPVIMIQTRRVANTVFQIGQAFTRITTGHS